MTYVYVVSISDGECPDVMSIHKSGLGAKKAVRKTLKQYDDYPWSFCPDVIAAMPTFITYWHQNETGLTIYIQRRSLKT